MSKKFISFIFGCLVIGVQGQELINQHWHFGDSVGLDFSTSPPTLEPSNLTAFSLVESAVISDVSGNLLLYSNGQIILNGEGEEVANSQFLELGIENIFAPYPGNPDLYYLFRSDANIGVDYSIVDISAMDGLGAVPDTAKEIGVHGYRSQLLVTSHANQMDYWLIAIDNMEGGADTLNITSFLINSDGIQMGSSFIGAYTFAGWYNYLEEARISQDCSTIAASHKGHHLTLFEFDNTTGEITDSFAQSVSLPDQFSQSQLNYIEFSPGGDYLYVIQDHELITRFSVTDFDPIAFQNSGEEVFTSDLPQWEHIKRGIDGRLYLIDDTDHIDIIDDAENEDVSMVVLLEDTIDLPGPASFFPNTFSTCQIFQTIFTPDICEGEISNLAAVGFFDADSVFWDIDLPPPADTLYYGLNPSIGNLEPGTYDVTFYYLFDTIWSSLDDQVIVYELPQLELGENQTICEGDEISLVAGTEDYQYNWNTGEQTMSIQVDMPGRYSVQVQNGACLVTDQVTIHMIYRPDINLKDTVLCDLIQSVVLDAQDNHADSYLWNTGASTPDLFVDSGGTYIVTATNSCFNITDSAKVTYVLIPDLVDDLYKVCHHDTLEVSSNYTLGLIEWSNGQTGSLSLIEDQGNFTIQVNDRGCMKFEIFEVERLPWLDVNEPIFPNIITPNNDEINGAFEPFVKAMPDVKPCDYSTFLTDIHIFNRWGDELISADCSWDGKVNEITVPDGVYYFVAEMQSVCLDRNESKEISGHFTILR